MAKKLKFKVGTEVFVAANKKSENKYFGVVTGYYDNSTYTVVLYRSKRLHEIVVPINKSYVFKNKEQK